MRTGFSIRGLAPSSCIALTLVWSRDASAHGGDVGELWSTGAAWTSDLRVLIPLYASALLFLLGTLRLWRRAGYGRGVRRWQVACFWSGWTVLALALLSPLHWLGERLFTAHMIEHELMMAVAAPLLVLARPWGTMLWALPVSWRVPIGGTIRHAWLSGGWRLASGPFAATLAHAVALWAWHMPGLYDLVLVNPLAHWLQHLSFLASALLFWGALLRGPARRRGYGVAFVYLFLTSLHTGLLGVLLTVSPRLWYPGQVAAAGEWGLTPLEDQQLAGLVMWVPAGLVYTIAALVLAGLWIRHSGPLRARQAYATT
ncbi:cytochrome c oxidase assembly protein [Methylorubrum extorquens]|nr:cytochrome c oxidase assembly protein [Methylorubrum extorquens]WIU39975.1 cytochrome c oxidase assembly protein [Methylorubrum extorquens]